MRFRLRTLLIVLVLGPPLLAGAWSTWQEYVRRIAIDKKQRISAIDSPFTSTVTLISHEE
jgi:hypothetical protein